MRRSEHQPSCNFAIASPSDITDTVQVKQNVPITASAPAVFNLRSSPNMYLVRPLFISKSGFLVGAEVNGNQNNIFERTRPLSHWNFVGSIPGIVIQLDFDTLKSGFALVGSRITSTNSLYSTSDGGRHWTLVSKGKYVQVHFFNNQNGIALSSPPGGPGFGAEILITSSGGRSWTQEPTSTLSQMSLLSGNYVGFSFASNEIGWLAFGGQPGAGSEEKWLFRTVNGGRSWTEVASSPPLTNPSFSSPETTLPDSFSLPLNGYLSQIRLTTPSLGYIALARGGRGDVLETVDGGIHWTGEQLLPANNFRSTSISEIATTPFGGVALTAAGSIWNQANSGAAWKEIYPPYRATSISYGSGKVDITTEQGRVIALGSNPSGASNVLGNFGVSTEAVNIIPGGEVVVTNTAIEIKRSGKGWAKIPVPVGWQINDGRFLNGSVGLVVTGPLTKALEVTLNGGHSWTKVPIPVQCIFPRSAQCNQLVGSWLRVRTASTQSL
ncbi:MAG: hypothetical protein HKL81_09905 [Acidimicrobiaceae bacterium]|nr:hypothetical protein [Acidimicrobiaceae bacterium]